MTKFEKVENGENTLRVAIQGDGPVILCVHGWPELWYRPAANFNPRPR